ncbi:MAG: prepilin-type N-terminal cleavage/methylation domain-containing protein [Verrucomicrobiaceae bacterium]|nr:prepilin-type N-terminal cleavage/methylation domain-containing protein [Verrucomicrobiaceae bacterium]
MNAYPPSSSIVQRGFTLMEMMIALAIMALLFAGVFGAANGTLDLSNDIVSTQGQAVMRQNFLEFLRRSFRNLPPEAEMRLIVQSSGGSYMPTLNFVNAGTSFSPAGPLPPDSSIDVFAEQRPGGLLRISLRLLDPQQTQSLRSGQPVRYANDQPIFPLVENVRQFEWRVFDGQSSRWENNWRDARRPLLAEMKLKLGDGEETRAVFWIPPLLPTLPGAGAPSGIPGGAPGGIPPVGGQPLGTPSPAQQ